MCKLERNWSCFGLSEDKEENEPNYALLDNSDPDNDCHEVYGKVTEGIREYKQRKEREEKRREGSSTEESQRQQICEDKGEGEKKPLTVEGK